MNTTTMKQASEKQLVLITRLRDEKALTETQAELLAAELDQPMSLTTSRASVLIEFLFSCPRKPEATSAKATPGYYRHGDDFVAVVETRDGQRTYAKRLVVEGGRASWEYAPGVGKTLAGMTPLTLEEAAGFGHLHGICMVCCRTLTNPASVEAGIGPVCASKF